MKLSEALERAKEAVADTDYGSMAQEAALHDLINAVEAYLEAQKKEAQRIVGLADLQRWDG